MRHDDVVRLVRPGRARPIVAGQPGGPARGVGLPGAGPLAPGRRRDGAAAGRRPVGATLMALAVVAAAVTVLAWVVRRSLS